MPLPLTAVIAVVRLGISIAMPTISMLITALMIVIRDSSYGMAAFIDAAMLAVAFVRYVLSDMQCYLTAAIIGDAREAWAIIQYVFCDVHCYRMDAIIVLKVALELVLVEGMLNGVFGVGAGTLAVVGLASITLSCTFQNGSCQIHSGWAVKLGYTGESPGRGTVS